MMKRLLTSNAVAHRASSGAAAAAETRRQQFKRSFSLRKVVRPLLYYDDSTTEGGMRMMIEENPRKKDHQVQQYTYRYLSSSSLANESRNAGFLHLWRNRVAQGKLHPDKAQERAAKRLHRLQQALAGYSNEEFFAPRPKPTRDQNEGDEQDKDETVVDEKSLKSSHVEESTQQLSTPLPNNVEGAKDVLSKEDKTQQDDNQQQQQGTSIHKNKEASEPPPPPLPQVPRGLYIWGPVGTGKSLLMDTFYSVVDVPQNKKQRFHFHAFMADVHARIHKQNQDDLKTKGRNFHVDTSQDHNPIVRVALQLSQETTLLCLDEFQVTDVADAMILSQLFDVFFLHGTVVVATSNRPPQELYEGGLNRSYFLPFLNILERHCIVHSLDSSFGDYRKMLSSMEHTSAHDREEGSIVLPNDAQFFFQQNSNKNHLDEIVKDLVSQIDSSPENPNNQLRSFDLKAGFGRTFTVAAGDPNGLIGKFHFEELCDRDFGASDYRALGQQFSIIALESIPPLSTFHHNRARRFITLIDELYEARCALVCSTEAAMGSPDELFPSEKKELSEGDPIQVGETLGIEDVQTQGGQPVSTLASVKELSFAFKRAASRLTEMTSRRWWNQVLQADGWRASDSSQ